LKSSEKYKDNQKVKLNIGESFGKFDDSVQEIIGKKQDMIDRITIVS